MTHKVLIVEDNEDTALVLKEYLEDYGFRVDVATSGKVGLKYLSRSKYDLLISDFKLPDMDAIGMLADASVNPSEIKTLFLTGFNIDERQFSKLNGLEYVIEKKPCRPKTILEHIKRLV